MNTTTHDAIVACCFIAGLIFGYGIFNFWFNWFIKNFKIVKKEEEKND